MTEYNEFYLTDYQKRYVGSNINDNAVVQQFFSKTTVDFISKEITDATLDVDERKRKIILPDDKILHLMNSVYLSYNPPQGFDSNWTPQQYYDSLINQVIYQAVFDITNVLGREQCVQKYSVWDSVLGDYNRRGLRGYGPIKLRERRPNTMEFNMKY